MESITEWVWPLPPKSGFNDCNVIQFDLSQGITLWEVELNYML